jgi:hypothetical protein
MRTLDQALLDAELPRLQAIARFWDVPLSTLHRRDAAMELAEAMTDPEAVERAWEALPDEQRRVLEALLRAAGRMPSRVFTRRWGEIRTMGPGRMNREQPWLDPASPAEGLWYTGLIAHAFAQGEEGTYEVTFVPDELRALLPDPEPEEDLIPTARLSPIPRPAHTDRFGDTLLDDACTLLAYLQNHAVRPRQDGAWPAYHERTFHRRLRVSHSVRLALLRHLAHGLEWLHEGKRGALRPDPDRATGWLQDSAPQQRHALATAWREDPAWNDLFHVPELKPADTGAWRNDPLTTRRAFLRHLATVCEPDQWYAIQDLVEAVKATAPDFQRPDGDYTSWYIRDVATGTYLSGFESWEAVEGRLIRHLLTGPLAWLGLTALGRREEGASPTAFRLTAAGAYFLELGPSAPPPDEGKLMVRPDFTVHIPPARRYERFQLSRVADWVRSGEPYVYRITPASLTRAQEQSIPILRVLGFLLDVADTPLPRTIEASLTRWEARGTEAHLERPILLRIDDAELMDQIEHSPLTQSLIRERLGPTTALVATEDWSPLVAALGQMGLLADTRPLEEPD